jgi:hypothetical protein
VVDRDSLQPHSLFAKEANKPDWRERQHHRHLFDSGTMPNKDVGACGDDKKETASNETINE